MNNVESMPARLLEHGLLLQQDKRLPDVAMAVAGKPMECWDLWADPRRALPAARKPKS